MDLTRAHIDRWRVDRAHQFEQGGGDFATDRLQPVPVFQHGFHETDPCGPSGATMRSKLQPLLTAAASPIVICTNCASARLVSSIRLLTRVSAPAAVKSAVPLL